MSAAASPPPQSDSPEQTQTQSQSQDQNAESKADANNRVSTSLYVGELEPSVTEAMLFELFNSIGPVASIRVCRDAVTRKSLGYAYVNFNNSADGDRALEDLNYTVIKGKACRIMWSQRDPALRKTGSGNVFIKNLDGAIDNKALHDTFSAFGNILSCKVATDDLGNSKGFGFVHYETDQAAAEAIKHVNGMLLNDKKVFVGAHVSKKERMSKFETMKQNFTNIYVKNVDEQVSEEDFAKLFDQFGSVTSCALARDPEGNSRGFGFVNYENHKHAEQAVEDLNDTEFHGKKLYVGRAQKKYEREEELRRSYESSRQEKMQKFQGVNLFVKNLDDEVDDERLRSEFANFGDITSAKVMTDEAGKSKGFGFVCFSSPEEATKAVTEMNQRMLNNKPLYVALAQRKDQRRTQLEAQVAARNQLRMQQQAAVQGMPAGYPGQMNGFYPAQQQQQFMGFQGRAMPGQPYPGMMPPQQRFPQQGRGMPAQGMYGPPMGQQFPGQGYPQGFPNQGRGGGRGGAMRQPMGPRGGMMPQGLGRGSMPPQQPQSGSFDMGGLSSSLLASASPENQKQMLGEALYPKVQATEPALAGKITGMLLEMENGEILNLLEDEASLKTKVNEALEVLKDWNDKQNVGSNADESEAPAPAAAAQEDAAEVVAEA